MRLSDMLRRPWANTLSISSRVKFAANEDLAWRQTVARRKLERAGRNVDAPRSAKVVKIR